MSGCRLVPKRLWKLFAKVALKAWPSSNRAVCPRSWATCFAHGLADSWSSPVCTFAHEPACASTAAPGRAPAAAPLTVQSGAARHFASARAPVACLPCPAGLALPPPQSGAAPAPPTLWEVCQTSEGYSLRTAMVARIHGVRGLHIGFNARGDHGPSAEGAVAALPCVRVS